MAVTLITGCSSGFGLLSALRFAREGHEVFATMRNTARAGELEAARDAGSLPITVVELDVDDTGSVNKAVGEVLDRAGHVDVLVNNAGFGISGPIEEFDVDAAKRVFETNVFGVLRVTQAVLPSMRERGSGAIVNVSSIAGVVSAPFGGIYAASKHALEAISHALHYELHPFGIRIGVVEPGSFETRFGENATNTERFDQSSPYWELAERFHESLGRIGAGGASMGGTSAGADPAAVVDVIYELATAPDPKPWRRLVGGDAEMIGTLRKQLDDDAFEQTMREALDFWE